MTNNIRLNGPVRVCDPGYEKDSKLGITLRNVLPGNYKINTFVRNAGSWGKRILSITARHEKHPGIRPEEYAGICCVDSGQCGIYDLRYFNENQPDDDFDNPESWYRRVCEMTMSQHQWGTMDGRCAVTSSGYGDGMYECSVARDARGQIIAIKINFNNQFA